MSAKPEIYLLSVALAVFLGACDGQSTMHLDDGRISVPVPAGVRQIAALNSLPLEIRVTLNSDIVREVPVSDASEAVSVVVNIPADQSNELELAWLAIIGTEKLLLADFSTTIAADTRELNVTNYINTGARFDTDNDGRTNLSEARDNRNLLSPFDLEVPFQNSFGGVFADLSTDGIDPDTSGDPIEQDEVTSFALRHDGNDMFVYVCGRDKTLQGDTSGIDEQYWHDDTVFIFIDGADSDNTSYDSIDDFQLAFVRQTGNMIVSKGSNNQFCANGSCIEHTFFSNSTTCEYELQVTLPLAEMNMSADAAIGFDIEITDDDNGGLREDSSAWIGFDDQSNLSPETFGTIILR